MEYADMLDDNFQDFHGIGGDAQYVVMQFTGLKDKNGKEIYEGDILEAESEEEIGADDSTSGVGYYKHHNAVIRYLLPECAFLGQLIGFDNLSSSIPKECEVVGNIYQDSHLLKNT